MRGVTMPQQPKYRQFRTVRATMNATGLDFKSARQLRTQTLRRSQQGKTILAREERRRHLQRLALPTPSHLRDYGPTAPHAVVIEARFEKVVKTARGYQTLREKRYITLTFKHRPRAAELDREVSKIYEEHAFNGGPMDDSDIDTDWILVDTRVDGYYAR
jgi:hypothetical protein